MEEEVRVILKDALHLSSNKSMSLAEIAREAVEPYGGFEIELPKRNQIRDTF